MTDMPKWLQIAKNLQGTQEVKGTNSNDVILTWAKSLGGWIKNYYKDDSIPWCGLFVTYVMFKSGYKVNQNGLAARSWLDWGNKCEPKPGAILIFSRSGGEHVTFCHEIDSIRNGYKCLGGNQSDEVNISFYPKKNLLGARWPSEDFLIKKI